MASKKTRHIPSPTSTPEAVHSTPDVPAASAFTDFPTRAIELGFAHVASALDFSTKLMNAKNVDEVLSLQNGFAKEQAASLKAQAAEMNDLALRTTQDMQETFARSMKEWAKPAA
jgi:hypothetical protein